VGWKKGEGLWSDPMRQSSKLSKRADLTLSEHLVLCRLHRQAIQRSDGSGAYQRRSASGTFPIQRAVAAFLRRV
jgi:hypothetical protein